LDCRIKESLRSFENRVLRKTLGLRVEKYQVAGANYKIRSFIICKLYQIIFV